MKKILLFIVAAVLMCSCGNNFKANNEVVDGEIYEVSDTAEVEAQLDTVAVDTTIAE